MSRRFVYFQGKSVLNISLFLEVRTNQQQTDNALTLWECQKQQAHIFYNAASEVGYADNITWQAASKSDGCHFYILEPRTAVINPSLNLEYEVFAKRGSEEYSLRMSFPENNLNWPEDQGRFSGIFTFPKQFLNWVSGSSDKNFGIDSTGTFQSIDWVKVLGEVGTASYPSDFPIIMTNTNYKPIEDLFNETGLGFDSVNDQWSPISIQPFVLSWTDNISMIIRRNQLSATQKIFYYDFSVSSLPVEIDIDPSNNSTFTFYSRSGLKYEPNEGKFTWLSSTSGIFDDSTSVITATINTAIIDFNQNKLISGKTLTGSVAKPPLEQANSNTIFEYNWCIN